MHDSMVVGAWGLTVAVAAISLLLLRRARARPAPPPNPSPKGIPDPPIVKSDSPVFITTHRGERYHLGALAGTTDPAYAVWTSRSHELVRLFDNTMEGWRAAWELFQRVEADDKSEWIDRRGARRSRREWLPAAQERP
jgi:hypothetical protein